MRQNKITDMLKQLIQAWFMYVKIDYDLPLNPYIDKHQEISSTSNIWKAISDTDDFELIKTIM